MSVLKPRIRLTTFRLSEEEYERLKAVAGAEGARSLSDFVRSGICWLVSSNNRELLHLIASAGVPMCGTNLTLPPASGTHYLETPPEHTIALLNSRIEALAGEVRRLSRRVEEVNLAKGASIDARASSGGVRRQAEAAL